LNGLEDDHEFRRRTGLAVATEPIGHTASEMKQQIGVDTESVGQSLQFSADGLPAVGYSSARQALDVFMRRALELHDSPNVLAQIALGHNPLSGRGAWQPLS
jgi:hypothetical protein